VSSLLAVAGIADCAYLAGGRRLQRSELSAEAFRLARVVHRLLPDDGEVTGLLALMLLTDETGWRVPGRTAG